MKRCAEPRSPPRPDTPKSPWLPCVRLPIPGLMCRHHPAPGHAAPVEESHTAAISAAGRPPGSACPPPPGPARPAVPAALLCSPFHLLFSKNPRREKILTKDATYLLTIQTLWSSAIAVTFSFIIKNILKIVAYFKFLYMCR